ncbi:MAG: hypothetical protein II678_08765 [Erysipelotrichaceae bacterium]|nr:hypothetical protein [Erysipelotrichaceae bacterium]
MAKTFKKIMNSILVLVLLMGVLSETINVFGEEEGNLEKESVESSFKAIWEKIEEENTFYQRPVLNRILKKLCKDSFLQSFIFLFLIFRSEAADTA